MRETKEEKKIRNEKIKEKRELLEIYHFIAIDENTSAARREKYQTFAERLAYEINQLRMVDMMQ